MTDFLEALLDVTPEELGAQDAPLDLDDRLEY